MRLYDLNLQTRLFVDAVSPCDWSKGKQATTLKQASFSSLQSRNYETNLNEKWLSKEVTRFESSLTYLLSRKGKLKTNGERVTMLSQLRQELTQFETYNEINYWSVE